MAIRTNLMSSCLWEDVSLALQLGLVLGTSFFYLVQQCVRWRSRSRSRSRSAGTHYPNHTMTSKMSLSCTAATSMACSTLLLCFHLWMLLTLLPNSQAHPSPCSSTTQLASSEIIQIVSWAFTLIALYIMFLKTNDKNNKYYPVRFPWILRAWWISNFLLSALRASLDAYFSITSHSHLQVRDYVDFFALLPSTFLLFISVHGKTGLHDLAFGDESNNGITDSLLQPQDPNRRHSS